MSVDASRNHGRGQLPVHLVGAGPGDPGLRTVRGAQLLRESDAIFHDELVDMALLDLAPAARHFAVGRRAGQGGRDPQQTAAEMAVLARRCLRVVRLKGGDPYLFGRGAEEAAALLALGIPFEVVPGVSSAFAAPASVGIPLTHRALASSVTILTGHRGLQSEPRWRALATGADTLVVMMGGSRLAEITRALMDGGRAASSPAAVVVAGTMPGQRHLISTLAAVAVDARGHQLGTPAVLVVGEVVSLAETLLGPALPALVAAAG